MATYFKIGNTDLSQYVAQLSIKKTHQYTSQQNAAGDSVVDYINAKRTIEVEIIPLLEKDFRNVLAAITFNPTISYRDPSTGSSTTANCILPDNNVEYYTIQANKVMYKKMKLKFTEL